MVAWSIPPYELSREDKYIELYQRRTEIGWTDRNVHSFEPYDLWEPTLQDIEDDILTSFPGGDFEGKLTEILNNENWYPVLVPIKDTQIFLEEPLNGQHLGYVKDLKDFLLEPVSDEEDEEVGDMVSLVEDESSSEADYGEWDNDEYPTEEDVHIATTPILSRSEREAMEECAIREWCREETCYENQMIMNIELIHQKMLEMYACGWPLRADPNPTIQDVAWILPLQTRPWEAAMREVLRMGAFPVHYEIFYLREEHIEFVKNLLDEMEGFDYDELQSWDGINDAVPVDHPEWQAEADAAAEAWEVGLQSEDMEKDKEKKESCMDAMNLLDTIMSSGECMKEADYLQMCNLLKELYH